MISHTHALALTMIGLSFARRQRAATELNIRLRGTMKSARTFSGETQLTAVPNARVALRSGCKHFVSSFCGGSCRRCPHRNARSPRSFEIGETKRMALRGRSSRPRPEKSIAFRERVALPARILLVARSRQLHDLQRLADLKLYGTALRTRSSWGEPTMCGRALIDSGAGDFDDLRVGAR